jgi:hypothetical protein
MLSNEENEIYKHVLDCRLDYRKPEELFCKTDSRTGIKRSMSLDLKHAAQIGHKGEREGITGRHSSPTAKYMAGGEKSRRH